jgi:hypothetical protein
VEITSPTNVSEGGNFGSSVAKITLSIQPEKEKVIQGTMSHKLPRSLTLVGGVFLCSPTLVRGGILVLTNVSEGCILVLTNVSERGILLLTNVSEGGILVLTNVSEGGYSCAH